MISEISMIVLLALYVAFEYKRHELDKRRMARKRTWEEVPLMPETREPPAWAGGGAVDLTLSDDEESPSPAPEPVRVPAWTTRPLKGILKPPRQYPEEKEEESSEESEEEVKKATEVEQSEEEGEEGEGEEEEEEEGKWEKEEDEVEEEAVVVDKEQSPPEAQEVLATRLRNLSATLLGGIRSIKFWPAMIKSFPRNAAFFFSGIRLVDVIEGFERLSMRFAHWGGSKMRSFYWEAFVAIRGVYRLLGPLVRTCFHFVKLWNADLADWTFEFYYDILPEHVPMWHNTLDAVDFWWDHRAWPSLKGLLKELCEVIWGSTKTLAPWFVAVLVLYWYFGPDPESMDNDEILWHRMLPVPGSLADLTFPKSVGPWIPGRQELFVPVGMQFCARCSQMHVEH